jgi:tRNA(Ile)-lysidine synthase
MSAGARVLAAVSGGSDSMALLLLLKAACSAVRVQVTAAYVDHGLRPATAMEAAFVAGLCRRLNVPCVTTEIPLLSHPSEAHLREERYAALARVATECGAGWIATGHTRDDQVETILFRFLRGSSRAGLAGMREIRQNLLRPLLGLGREDLRAWLRDTGVGWVEDPSNASLRYTRNKIRHLLIPAVEETMGSGRLRHLPTVAELWRCEDAYLEQEASRFSAYVMRGTGAGLHIDLVAFAAVPEALRPRVLRTWLRTFGHEEIPLARLRAIMTLGKESGGNGRLTLEGLTVIREYEVLCAFRSAPRPLGAEQEVCVDSPGAYVGPNGEWTLTVDPRPRDDAPATRSLRRQVVEFAVDVLETPLRLRQRRPGDAIRTQLHGRRKVHDIMIEARVPRRERDTWPVLTSAHALIWIPGLAVAAEMESALRAKGAPRVRFAWHRRSQ